MRTVRMFILGLATVMALTVLAPIAGYASPEGNRNTAIGLAGAAAYLLIKGKTVPGIAAAAGAAYAYNRSEKQREEQKERERYSYYNRGRYYDNRYGSGPVYRNNNGQCASKAPRPVYKAKPQYKPTNNRGNHYGWDRGRRR